ncbi:hypothetical protein Ro103_22 [Escherichia phage vB_EcoP-Ro103C3lw]|nr:hypothetical protein Ro103_22 [Escherichia phage vB_EcoP-Ro103C3lw]
MELTVWHGLVVVSGLSILTLGIIGYLTGRLG